MKSRLEHLAHGPRAVFQFRCGVRASRVVVKRACEFVVVEFAVVPEQLWVNPTAQVTVFERICAGMDAGKGNH